VQLDVKEQQEQQQEQDEQEEKKKNPSSPSTTTTTTSPSSHIFTRITPLLTYQVPVLSRGRYRYVFRVRAHNKYGWSTYSLNSITVETLDTAVAIVETARTIKIAWPRVVVRKDLLFVET
jgi:hypothetical protein